MDGMNNDAIELDALLARLRALRVQREELERALELTRRESRTLTLQLIFDHEYSINKAAVSSGHMRPTLKVWIESELAKNPGTLPPAHLRHVV